MWLKVSSNLDIFSLYDKLFLVIIMIDEIMRVMDTIEYGVPSETNENLFKFMDEDEVFNNYYYLQTPEELMSSKIGVCWDQVELERFLFNKENILVECYWICNYDKDNVPSHTFLIFEKNNKYYWFEHSWGEFKGIHEYNSKKELLLSVKDKFMKSHDISSDDLIRIYLYDNPKFHMNVKEFYDFIEREGLLVS